MTPAELSQLLAANPDLAIIPERGSAPTPAQQATRQAAVRAAQVQQIATAASVPAQFFDMTEEQMQAAVIRWADSQSHPALKWLFHVPNGGHRDPATAGRMKAAGVRRGVPDLLLVWARLGDDDWRRCGLAIEMKKRPNKPTPEQLAWLKHLQVEGWHTEVCYSAQAAIDTIRAYLDID